MQRRNRACDATRSADDGVPGRIAAAKVARRPGAGRLMFGTSRLAVLVLFALLAAPPHTTRAETAIPPQPRVEAERLDGTRYSLADDRSAVTVLVVWSPESLASRKSFGELQRFAAKFGPRGVRTQALSTFDEPDKLRDFVAARRVDLPVARLKAHDLGPLREQNLPLIYVFDRRGNLRASHAGLFRLRDIEQRVEPLLAE